MAARERRRDRALALARRIRTEAGTQARIARRTNGVSIRAAAASVGLDFSTYARIERGELEHVTLEQLVQVHTAVGLAPTLRSYPKGDAVRDAPQRRLLERFRIRVAPLVWQTEVPIPIPGDLRALDARMSLEGRWIGIEAETQLFDLQAIERKILLKKRDAELDSIILLVADTAGNRRVLRQHRESLRGSFPLDTRNALGECSRGRAPRADGIVIL